MLKNKIKLYSRSFLAIFSFTLLVLNSFFVNSKAQTQTDKTDNSQLLIKNELLAEDRNHLFALCVYQGQNLVQSLQIIDSEKINLAPGKYNFRLSDLSNLYGNEDSVTQTCKQLDNNYPFLRSKQVDLKANTTSVLQLKGNLQAKDQIFLTKANWQIRSNKSATNSSIVVTHKNLTDSQFYPLSRLCANGEIKNETASGSGLFDLESKEYNLSLVVENKCDPKVEQYKMFLDKKESVFLEVDSQILGTNPQFDYPNLQLSWFAPPVLDLKTEQTISTDQNAVFRFGDLNSNLKIELDSQNSAKHGEVTYDQKRRILRYKALDNFIGEEKIGIIITDSTSGSQVAVELTVKTVPWRWQVLPRFPF